MAEFIDFFVDRSLALLTYIYTDEAWIRQSKWADGTPRQHQYILLEGH